MEEGAVGWSWRGSNGAVRWSSLLSSLAAAPWAALQVLLHTVDLDEEVPRLVPRLAIILHGPRRQHTDGPTYRCEMGPRRRRLSC